MFIALHAPDGFLEPGTAIVTGIISIVVIGLAFPVAAGTTGHLLGGALAAILLGPSVGAIIVTVVVVVQALAFADGGLTALGYNVLNMAIVVPRRSLMTSA